MARSERLVWEIVAVLIFKAAFFWGIWACCFRQDPESLEIQLDFIGEVRHGAER